MQLDPQKLRILIVEDDPMMRIGLKHMLSAQPLLELVNDRVQAAVVALRSGIVG
ncbi:two component transcriptional regulator, LuxR family protein [Calothrix sp. NIES-4071]|nr:two component transcriptional regulator, LuxR family protein [Calothrix sp. NIES-4071]BAZ56088.1 two component transcriptional regulator, LuxR family protein [Calothrix sp. NIES-4105]